MKINELYKMIQQKPIILDGATGSNLQKAGMKPGVCPEEWILENEDKFSKLGIIINDYLEKILSLENENVYVDNAKDVERILNYYQKSVLLYPEFDGEILAKGLISDVYSGKLKLPITVDDVMLCEVDEYVREDELLFELEWIIIFLSIVYNVGLK